MTGGVAATASNAPQGGRAEAVIESRRYRFRSAQRVRKQREFDRAYQARAVKRVGPLRVHGVPNELGHSRLGLSVSRRVGNAVQRNRYKRLLREAFRLLQHELPAGYDFVVVVLRHDELELADYQRLLMDAAQQLEALWAKRRKRATGEEATDGG